MTDEPQTAHDALEDRVRRLELTMDSLRDAAATFLAAWNIHTPEGAPLFDQDGPTCQVPMIANGEEGGEKGIHLD